MPPRDGLFRARVCRLTWVDPGKTHFGKPFLQARAAQWGGSLFAAGKIQLYGYLRDRLVVILLLALVGLRLRLTLVRQICHWIALRLADGVSAGGVRRVSVGSKPKFVDLPGKIEKPKRIRAAHLFDFSGGARKGDFALASC